MIWRKFFVIHLLFVLNLANLPGPSPTPDSALAPHSRQADSQKEKLRREREEVLAEIFGHLNGLAIVTTIKALWDKELLQKMDIPTNWWSLTDLVKESKANRAYLRVALRLLSSYGWLAEGRAMQGRSVWYRLTEEGRIAFKMLSEYQDSYQKLIHFLPKAIRMQELIYQPGAKDKDFEELVSLVKNELGKPLPNHPQARMVAQKCRQQMIGFLMGPAMMALSWNRAD